MMFPQVISYPILLIGVIFLFFSNMNQIGNMAQLFPLFLFPMVIVIISMLFCVFVLAFEKRKKTADIDIC